MRSAPASLLRHVGHGPLHADLVLGAGSCCPTVSFEMRSQRGGWKPPHRRRYLAYAGPVGGGRGRVERLWSGRVAWHRIAGGWRFRLPSATLDLHGSLVVRRGWLARLR